MPLETGINSDKNSACNGELTRLVENGQIVLLDEPVMFYRQENIERGCGMVLNPHNNGNNENLNIPQIVFDGNYFPYENGNLQNGCNLHANYQCMNERQQVDDGLAVLEILCNNKSALDQPEFVDINKLSEVEQFENSKNVDVLCISDDDDVVFVREYKDESKGLNKKVKDINTVSPKKNKGIRRNPIRKARINSKRLSKEHILEEDFALLDTSDEEKRENKENKVPNRKPVPETETLKQWPVNAHERPEYNAETKKIEAFDYTIREIQKKAPNKKPRLETVPVKRKSKKKYFTRKRKPRVVQPKKVAITELKPLVNATTGLLKGFFERCKASKDLINNEHRNAEKCSLENKLEVFKNQVILFSLVNELGEDDIAKKLDEISFTENETKQ